MKTIIALAFGLAVVLVVAGCRQKAETSKAVGRMEAVVTDKAGGGMEAVVTDKSLDGALTAAKGDGKPVVAIFSAPAWCGWCQKLDKETLSDVKVQQELKRFHVVFVDFDKEKDLAREHGVRAVPTTILLDSAGKKVNEIPGFRNAADFVTEIKQAFPATEGAVK